LFGVGLVLWGPQPLEASQIANHLRIAHFAWEDPRVPLQLRLVILRHFPAYLAGAAGPDVYTNLVGQYDELAHMPHYHRTGRLIREMLGIAYAQPDVRLRERYLAYTLGWITHYYVDTCEHQLVNRFGGYYKHDAARHKTLETFEIAHVLARSEHPDTLPYVAPASGLPAEFVTEALRRTFPERVGGSPAALSAATCLATMFGQNCGPAIQSMIRRVRSASPTMTDIEVAAAILEEFTLIGIDEFRSQRRVGTVQEETMGLIPFQFEYERLLAPVELTVTRASVDPRGTGAVAVEAEWVVHDDSLTIAYVTDWYEANRRALADIVGTFRSVSATVWRTPVELPDFDLDSGLPEGSAGDAQAMATSRSFRRVRAAEIDWAVVSPTGAVLDTGAHTIDIGARPVARETRYRRMRTGRVSFRIPARSSFFSTPGRQIAIRVRLRLMNNNPSLMTGRYVTAFKFPAKGQSMVERRLDVDAIDEWRLELAGLEPRVPPPQPATGDPAIAPGAVWRQSETYQVAIGGTWTLDGSGKRLQARWANGAEATLTLVECTETTVVVTRNDQSGVSKGLHATYRGKRTGNRVTGTVDWVWPDGRRATGTWTATLPSR
jgi:hypothetical protein